MFTCFSTTMSYISSTALCMLICNIHYCRLSIHVSNSSIKPWPQILTCFAFRINYAILVYVVIMCHTVNPDVATYSTSTIIQHICSNASQHCSNAAHRNFTPHIVISHSLSIWYDVTFKMSQKYSVSTIFTGNNTVSKGQKQHYIVPRTLTVSHSVFSISAFNTIVRHELRSSSG